MYKKEQAIINKALKKYLPKDNSILSRAMRYSVFAGGKRFRPVLMLKTAQMLKGKTKDILPAAAAVEMIHTFTLIHDDLPCMDNSDLRRGKVTCHNKFGEDIALLAGDALNTLAFKVIADYCPPKFVSKIISELSRSLLDVVEGQVLDLEAENKRISEKKLMQIHLKKTAALIKASVKITAILSKSPKNLEKYGEGMGLAFQIADDILDFTSNPEKIGKPTGADQENNKSTYPILLGVEKSKILAHLYYKKAIAELKSFGKRADKLKEIAEFAIRRLK